MKTMLAGFAAMIVISIGAYFVLGEVGSTSQEQHSSDAVRLD